MAPTLITVAPGAERAPWIELLALADEPEPLRRCAQDGVLYGVRHDDTGAPVAAILTIDLGDAAAELRAVAVAEDEQGRGMGSWIVTAVRDRLRDEGFHRVVVGTSSSGTRQLAFYQRLGFRLTHIEHDFFSPARGYDPTASENGIPVRDMVWMSQDI